MKTYTIGVGIILNDKGQVLIDQRLSEATMGGLWEFPGGKQEEGELVEETIARELQEELGLEVAVARELISLDNYYNSNNYHFKVHICKIISGEPKPLSSQQIKWVFPADLESYSFPKINSKIIKALNDYLN